MCVTEKLHTHGDFLTIGGRLRSFAFELKMATTALHIGSAERKAIEVQGFGVADQLEKLPL